MRRGEGRGGEERRGEGVEGGEVRGGGERRGRGGEEGEVKEECGGKRPRERRGEKRGERWRKHPVMDRALTCDVLIAHA